MEGETTTMQEIFQLRRTRRRCQRDRVMGRPFKNGIRPRFAERFKQYGMQLPAFF